jgi:hypothetical protein
MYYELRKQYKDVYKYKYAEQEYWDSCPTKFLERATRKTEIIAWSLDPFQKEASRNPLPPPPNHADADRCRANLRPKRTPSHRGFERTAEDTRRHGRVEAGTETPSVGAAPQAPLAKDRSSPMTTAAATGRSSSIHPPANRITRSLYRTLRRGDRLEPPPPRTTRRRQPTPVQISHKGRPTSTGSPSAPE